MERPAAQPATDVSFPVGLDATRALWLRTYAHSLVLLDTAILTMACLFAVLVRFGTVTPDSVVHQIPYLLLVLCVVPIWIATLTLSRCYETRFLGNGTEEFKRVASAGFRVAAVVVFVAYGTKTDFSRAVVGVTLIGGLLGVTTGRYAARLWLQHERRNARRVHRVVVVGPPATALEITQRLQQEPLSGLQVVAACLDGNHKVFTDECRVPVYGEVADMLAVLQRVQADTVCIAGGPGMTPDVLRQLSYELEGTGVDLLVAPALTNVMGTRLTHRTIPGLPLLHVEEPELGGSRRLVKALFDLVVGSLLLLALTPVLLSLALAIRLTSRGPALFRQVRVGQGGQLFTLWKFRSMYVDAEDRLAEVHALSMHDPSHLLFKIQDDPRVTSVGRLLRKYSLDELPQLLNVLRGQMSLVGPRPPLPAEVERYEQIVHRRLLVKPGMTGLWQVSGRADLPWDEAVRLDLHYVENWSLGLDVAILCRTVVVILRPWGAY